MVVSVFVCTSRTSVAEPPPKVDWGKAVNTAFTDGVAGMAGGIAVGAVTGGPQAIVVDAAVGFVGGVVEGAVRSVVEDITSSNNSNK